MKKIFYILTAAIVALGAMACENEGIDNIGPEANGEGLTITATVSRVAWNEDTFAPTAWEAGDVITIDGFEFTTTDGVNFVCNNKEVYSLCDGLVHTATTTLNSEIGLKGAELTAQGVIKEVGTSLTFKTASALLMFTTTETVTLNGEGLFSTGNSITITGIGETQYVPVKATTADFSYSISGTTCKEMSNVTFGAGTIYDLGELTTVAAKVGNKYYETLAEALAAANGATVTLLADGEVSEACQINTNNHTLTVTGNFVALKNYQNNSGYYDVVAATKHAEYKLRGSWDAGWSWETAIDIYEITGTKLWVAPEVSLTANQMFKFADQNWSDSWGANVTTSIAADTWSYAGGNDIKVKTAGTYNVYYEYDKGVYSLTKTTTQYKAPVFVTYYLNANIWDVDGAWFLAHFWDSSTNVTYDIKLTAVAGKSKHYASPELLKGAYDKVIFLRMSPSGTQEHMWTQGNTGHWNKTGNITLPTDSKNLFKITSWDNQTSGWSTYQ